jgi:predicted nucleotidyltransferase
LIICQKPFLQPHLDPTSAAIGEHIDLKEVTPVGLMALKIIAWSERYPQPLKDALDIAFILRNFVDADHQSLLWEKYDGLIKEEID